MCYLGLMENKDPTEFHTASQSFPSDQEPTEQAQVPFTRSWTVPIVLFGLTCMSTFWVGVTNWQPTIPMEKAAMAESMMPIRQVILANWQQGLIYMGCVLAILLLHELGHFVATLLYRIPATAPIFLPFPLNPIGTLGAVIGMQGKEADRRQIFDIGIAGPLAGLVVAVPLAIIGIQQLDLSVSGSGYIAFECPLAFRWLISLFDIRGYEPGQGIWLSQLNPYFAAAWVGFLITGLNMIPVGQMDGGHVTYALFKSRAHLIAQLCMIGAIAMMTYFESYVLVIMVILMLLVGIKHPPTRDDNVKLGWFRYALGIVSLSIPVLCFPPTIFILGVG